MNFDNLIVKESVADALPLYKTVAPGNVLD